MNPLDLFALTPVGHSPAMPWLLFPEGDADQPRAALASLHAQRAMEAE